MSIDTKTKLQDILEQAQRLHSRGPQSMYPEDEARHLADRTLDLLIELLTTLEEAERDPRSTMLVPFKDEG